MNLILASASPRRESLLRQVGISCRVIVSSVDEFLQPGGEKPGSLVIRLAAAKAKQVSARQTAGLVLGADTVVVHRGKVLGKPGSAGEARRMLMRLSGGRHSVFTGMALVNAATGQIVTGFTETRVWMRDLEVELIDAYVATGEPMDKAGAYGIQGKAAFFVEKIEGCYTNVVGLPLSQLYLLLSRMEIQPWSNWRDNVGAGRRKVDH